MTTEGSASASSCCSPSGLMELAAAVHSAAAAQLCVALGGRLLEDGPKLAWRRVGGLERICVFVSTVPRVGIRCCSMHVWRVRRVG